MPSIFVQSLTPKLRRLLSADARARSAVEALTPEELTALTAAARSNREPADGLASHRAIGLLALAARPEVAMPVLVAIAQDRSARATNRVAALNGLAQLASPDAQTALVAHARDAEPRVQIAALAALGQFADRSALSALDAVDGQDDATRRQLALTRALIAHREGLDGPFLPERQGQRRDAVAATRMSTLTLAMKSAEATAADLAKLTGPTFGVQPAARGYDLQCGRARWTVFGNAELGPAITANPRLFERPWILALAARWQPPGLGAAVQYLVLSRPAGRGVRLDVVRSDGEVVYTGTAEAAGVGLALSFTIADVDRPATAPTTFSGVLDANDVRLDVAILHDQRVGTRRTQPTRP